MVKYDKEARTYKNQSTVKKDLYNWILQHPQVVHPPIANDYLKLYTDGHSETQFVPKYLLHVSVR